MRIVLAMVIAVMGTLIASTPEATGVASMAILLVTGIAVVVLLHR